MSDETFTHSDNYDIAQPPIEEREPPHSSDLQAHKSPRIKV